MSEEQNIDQETLEQVASSVADKMDDKIDGFMQEKAKEMLGPMVSKEVEKTVKKLRAERAVTGGYDKTGLTKDQKEEFVENVKHTLGFKAKADALIESDDSRGGYLVPEEVESSIRRIAASVGLIMSQAETFNMGSDTVRIPSYRGSFLEGAYVDEDSEGNTTDITFSQARLIAKTWQLAFPLSNELIQDANVTLADWLLGLAGEAMANMVDKQGFNGTGNPFVGVLNNSDIGVYPINSGSTFASFDPLVDGSDVPAQLNKSIRTGAAWYMEDTVWAKIRQKTSSNNPLLGYAGQATDAVLKNNPAAQNMQPDGELMGYPVFTTKHLPANSVSSQGDTEFMVFGNFRAAAIGRRQNLTVEQHKSGNFDGKEIALANQTGIIFRNRHAFVVSLPSGFIRVKTNAS